MIAFTLEGDSVLLTDLLDVLFAVDCSAVRTPKHRILSTGLGIPTRRSNA